MLHVRVKNAKVDRKAAFTKARQAALIYVDIYFGCRFLICLR